MASPTVFSDISLGVTLPAGAVAGPVAVSATTAGGSDNGLTCFYVVTLTLRPVDLLRVGRRRR